MLLPHYEGIATTMNHNPDAVKKGVYVERLLQRQHQQSQRKIQQEVTTNVKDGMGKCIGNHNNCNERAHIGKSAFTHNKSLPGINGSNSSSIGISNSGMIIGINYQQQQHQQQRNHMIAFLQEEQQQLVATRLVSGPSDLTCNVALPGLSNNVSLDSQFRGRDCGVIGSGTGSNAWVGGFSDGGLIAGQVRGATNGSGLYSVDQDIFSSSHRYPSVRGNVGGNQLVSNYGSNTSLGGRSLNPTMGGLSRFALDHQALAQASLNSYHKANGKSFTDMILAKQAHVAFFEATKAQVPRTNRLPCGARGMKSDHNSSTAYFDIPENARHGQHLLCSHSVCRAAGVKFRYCFYCKKPVTKQNFRSRHLHADLDPSNKKGENKITNSSSKGNKNKPGPETNKTNITSKSNAHTIKKTLTTTSQENAIKRSTCQQNECTINSLDTFQGHEYEKERCCSRKEECLERPSKVPKILDSNVEPVCRKRSQWAALLEERPSDGLEAIHAWTGKILSTSNPEMDTFVCGSRDLLHQRSQQDQNFDLDDVSSKGLSMYWNTLLDERPSGDRDESSVTRWLVRALEVSEKYKNVKNYKFYHVGN